MTVEDAEIPNLLEPWYLQHADAKPLRDGGLVVYDEAQEQYEHTPEGRAAAGAIRERYRMTWDGEIPGGGRWVVAGHGLSCSDALEVMLHDGTWLPVRFEVEFTRDAAAQETGGRTPVLHLGIAGTGALRCRFPAESHALFRRPEKA